MFSKPGDTMVNVLNVVDETIEFVWKPWCTEHSPVYSLQCAQVV